jgi:putative endonuclease
MYYTYVLLSKKDRRFYIGYTLELTRRVKEHNGGKVYSTRGRLPLILIYYEAGVNKFDAIKREKYLKSGFGGKYLKNRLKYFLKGLRE